MVPHDVQGPSARSFRLTSLDPTASAGTQTAPAMATHDVRGPKARFSRPTSSDTTVSAEIKLDQKKTASPVAPHDVQKSSARFARPTSLDPIASAGTRTAPPKAPHDVQKPNARFSRPTSLDPIASAGIQNAPQGPNAQSFRLSSSDPSTTASLRTQLDLGRTKLSLPDPLDDFQVENPFLRATSHSHLLVHPEHRFRVPWDWVIVWGLVYTMMVIPFEVAFLSPAFNALFFISIAIDFLFLMDMGLIMCTPIVDPDTGLWIVNHWEIFKVYARFWFWIDLISTFPYEVIAVMLEDGEDSQLLRIIRLLRLVKLMNLPRMQRIVDRRKINQGWKNRNVRLGKLVLMLLIFSHWVSCLFAMVPVFDYQTYDDLSPAAIANGTKPSSWIVGYFEGALGMTYGDYNIWSIYLAGYYYAIMTLATFGYGDVLPKTDAERGVAAMIMLTGATLWAYAVGTACNVASSGNETRKQFLAESDDFATYLDQKKFPREVKKQIKIFVHQVWRIYQRRRHIELLDCVDDVLKGTIAKGLLEKSLPHIPFISTTISPEGPGGEYDGFLCAVALEMQIAVFPPLEPIFTRGQAVDRMYIVDRGAVILHASDVRLNDRPILDLGGMLYRRESLPDVAVDQEMTTGSSFGSEMIIKDFKSLYNATSVTFVHAFFMTRETLDQILLNFPITKKNIEMLAKRKNWAHFVGKMQQGLEIESHDPEDLPGKDDEIANDMVGVKKITNEIVILNKDIKALQLRILLTSEKLFLREELIAVQAEQ